MCQNLPLFLRLNDILLYARTFCSSCYPSADIQGCFHLLTAVDNATMNTGVHTSGQVLAFSFLGYISTNGTAGSHGDSIFRFGVFSTAAEWFYIPNSSHKSSDLPTVSVTFVTLFGNNYPSGYGTVPHCAFSLCFPKWCRASFHVRVFWVLTLYWMYAFPVFSLIPWVASEVFFVTLIVLATPHSLGDLCSLTRDWTWAPCSEGAES